MIRQIAFKYTFYGYRRIHHVNHKRVYRIYRSLDLQRHRPRKNKKVTVIQLPLTEPQYPNHIWAVDFLFDALTKGRHIKFMTVEDLFSRFSPGIDSQFSIPAKRVVEVLKECIRSFDAPRIIRSDQGPEFRSKTFQKCVQLSALKGREYYLPLRKCPS